VNELNWHALCLQPYKNNPIVGTLCATRARVFINTVKLLENKFKLNEEKACLWGGRMHNHGSKQPLANLPHKIMSTESHLAAIRNAPAPIAARPSEFLPNLATILLVAGSAALLYYVCFAVNAI
jgi:hypothetical protein